MSTKKFTNTNPTAKIVTQTCTTGKSRRPMASTVS